MHLRFRSISILLLFLLAFILAWLPIAAQTLIGTVPVGVSPSAIAVNPDTNKTYVTNGGSWPNNPGNTVTVIDGRTLSTSTVDVGYFPTILAVNSVTNKIYVANYCGTSETCNGSGPDTVTVIDGTTLSTTTVTVGYGPQGIAINSVTNKIYVANTNGNNVTVIDGATLSTATVAVGNLPGAVAVNPVTNKIYVLNDDGTMTVIDGATRSTSTVVVGSIPIDLAINLVTNKIYVLDFVYGYPYCYAGFVTVVDGATLSTTGVGVGVCPDSVTVNAVTNKAYVTNTDDSTVTVIDGITLDTATVAVGTRPAGEAVNLVTNKTYIATPYSNAVTIIDGATLTTSSLAVGYSPGIVANNPVTNRMYVVNECGNDPNCRSHGTVSVIAGSNPIALQFVPVAPCRLLDTRPQYGGSGPLQGGTSRDLVISQLGGCHIPTTAAAYSLNVTVVPQGLLGYLTIWPTGESRPISSTLNSDGRVKADAAIVIAGSQGAVSVYVTNTTNLVLDINGYFEPADGSTLAYYPLKPCRVADTRNANGPLGGPHLMAGQERDFPILDASACDIPSSAQAYSLNFTVVPRSGPVETFTAWRYGQPRPVSSTLNAPTGTVVANAAIVSAGTGGEIATWATNDTDLVIDIDGYFAPAGAGGLSLYAVAPCRVIDTRKGNGAFNGVLSPPVDVADSVCAPPSTAQAYVLNATVVPTGSLAHLDLWPDGEDRPGTSTLNDVDGAITSNMAVVPNINGKTDAYALGLTQLILDISAYFAP
jgi:YVTN family beta-propeller protein